MRTTVYFFQHSFRNVHCICATFLPVVRVVCCHSKYFFESQQTNLNCRIVYALRTPVSVFIVIERFVAWTADTMNMKFHMSK